MKFLILFLALSTNLFASPLDQLTLPEKIKYFYNKSSKEDMSLVTQFYHPEAEFIDPVGSMKGAENLKAYYTHLYQNVKSINFDFSKFYQDGNTVIAIWKMNLQTDNLNGGELVSVDGNSVIVFDAQGKAISHRDYFDLGAMVYEHIPVLGYVVRSVKGRLKHQ